tara:strand:+ start:270 stop:455 length:186 start_codon:yes stop_codon:yes gene_type:complete
MDYEEWKKGIIDKIKNIGFEKVPSLVKICPKCQNISLEFDVKAGIIKCTKCGFEEKLPILK